MLELGTCVAQAMDEGLSLAERRKAARARVDELAALGLGVTEVVAQTGYQRSSVVKFLTGHSGRFPSEARLGRVFDALLVRFSAPHKIRRGFELADLEDAMDCLLQGISVEQLFDRKYDDLVSYRGVLVAVAYGHIGRSLYAIGRRWDYHHTSLMNLVRKFAEPRGWQADEAGFRLAVANHARSLAPQRFGAKVVV